jgi:hypothetical protein
MTYYILAHGLKLRLTLTKHKNYLARLLLIA